LRAFIGLLTTAFFVSENPKDRVGNEKREKKNAIVSNADADAMCGLRFVN